jgi:HD-GYP domain-containing protein (c-di-GMP phosphodiesterase class II)
MAVILAGRFGLQPSAITDIERGALLHDIGKVAMPDAIINKPGPLSEPEVAVVWSHPQVGHDIVSIVPALKPAAEIILASHERFDGRGYPRGLVGAAIPIGARITSVADVFDVLTSPRAYRGAVSTEQACAELARCSGSQFDPDVVREWLRLVGAANGSSSWQAADWLDVLATVPVGGSS